MNTQLINWKLLALLSCSLALATGVQAQNVSSGVAVRATDPTALEGTTGGAFTLIRYGDTNGTLTVHVNLTGTAVNGVDYQTLGSSYTLGPGVLAIDVPVLPIIDTAVRGNKTVVFNLQSDPTYAVVGRGLATVKIVDDVFDIPPPSVTLVQPADGSVFTASSTVSLEADVDSELPVNGVSFFANDTFLGSVTNPPYTLTWTANHTGNFALFARAENEIGKSGVSSVVHVTVSSGPVVTLDTSEGTNYVLGQTVALTADIGDPNEAIKSVSFYVNGKVVGTVKSAPFTFEWQPETLGTYTVQAVATDKKTGKTGSSPKVQYTILPNVGV